MNVYLSGSFSGRERVAKEAARLELYGYNVLSWWFNHDHFVEKAWDGNFKGDIAKTMAHCDFNQLLQAELFILDTIDKSSTGGSDTELGMALIRAIYQKIHLVHIGPNRNIFQALVYEHYDSWDEFFNKLDLKEELNNERK